MSRLPRRLRLVAILALAFALLALLLVLLSRGLQDGAFTYIIY